ncbi:hypothetical protein [Streptomyces sp. NEAU-NA10]|uniref:hypothetical protein n=1 Tax=Streptomyces sp. NEAU-NA10 TaxID=3416050 RepID=UPI003CC64645
MLTIVLPMEPDPHPEPRYEDYPTHDAYLLAWYTWRALRRDERLTDEELTAQFEVTEQFIKARNPDALWL